MKYEIKQIVSESKIVNFFKRINTEMLLCFYKSRIYGIFIKLLNFFKEQISKNIDKSVIIKGVKYVFKNVSLGDLGYFIILVVIFNTLVMLVLKKEIDIFSICARVFFFCLGVLLACKRNQKPEYRNQNGRF